MEQWGKLKLKPEGVVVTTSREQSKPSLRARELNYTTESEREQSAGQS